MRQVEHALVRLMCERFEDVIVCYRTLRVCVCVKNGACEVDLTNKKRTKNICKAAASQIT